MRLTSKEDIYTNINSKETQNVTEKVIEYLGLQFPIDLKIDPRYLCIKTKKKSILVNSPYLDSTGTLNFYDVEEKTKINKYLRRKFVFSKDYFHFEDDRKNYLDVRLKVAPTVNLCDNLHQLQLLAKKLYRSKKNGFSIFETVCNTLNITRADIVSLEIPQVISYKNEQLDCVFEKHKEFSVRYNTVSLEYITDTAKVKLSPYYDILNVNLSGTQEVLESLSLKTLFNKASEKTALLVEKVADFNSKE